MKLACAMIAIIIIDHQLQWFAIAICFDCVNRIGIGLSTLKMLGNQIKHSDKI